MSVNVVSGPAGSHVARGTGTPGDPYVPIDAGPVHQFQATFSDSVGLGFYVASAVVQYAGHGYAVGDTVTVAGGTESTAAVFTVTAVDGTGGVTAVSITSQGCYTVKAASPASQGSTSGSGAGAMFTLTWAQIVSAAIMLKAAGALTMKCLGGETITYSSGHLPINQWVVMYITQILSTGSDSIAVVVGY